MHSPQSSRDWVKNNWIWARLIARIMFQMKCNVFLRSSWGSRQVVGLLFGLFCSDLAPLLPTILLSQLPHLFRWRICHHLRPTKSVALNWRGSFEAWSRLLHRLCCAELAFRTSTAFLTLHLSGTLSKNVLLLLSWTLPILWAVWWKLHRWRVLITFYSSCCRFHYRFSSYWYFLQSLTWTWPRFCFWIHSW